MEYYCHERAAVSRACKTAAGIDTSVSGKRDGAFAAEASEKDAACFVFPIVVAKSI